MVTTLPTIALGSSRAKKTQGKVSRALDIISAPLSQPKTTLFHGIGAGATAVRESREKIATGQKSATGTIITTLATTSVVAGGVLAVAGGTAGGVAGAVARKGAIATAKTLAPKTAKGVITTASVGLLGYGLMKTTGGRELIENTPQRIIKTGETIGQIAGGEKDITGKDILKIGAVVGGTAGAVALGYAGYKYFTREKNEKVVTTAPAVMPAQTYTPAVVTEQTPSVIAETPTTKETITQPTIKISNKPQINIAIAR